MGTTLLFAELLIAGLLSLVWIFLIVLNFTGISWLNTAFLRGVSDWAVLATLYILAISYVVGIIIDRIADTVFDKWNKNLAKKIIPIVEVPISTLRFELGKENEYLNSQFEYTRSRMRIVRSSSVNFFLIMISAITFIIRQSQFLSSHQRWIYIIATIIIGSVLTVGSVNSWRVLTLGYYQLVKTNYKEER